MMQIADDMNRVMWLLVTRTHWRLVMPQQQMFVMDSADGEGYFLVPHGERNIRSMPLHIYNV